jgi:imidazolonepropionase-like amidohydrolase
LLRVVLDPGAPLLNAVRADTALALGVTSIEHAQGAWSSVLRADLDEELTAFMASGAPPTEGEDLVMRIMTQGEASVDPGRLAALAAAWSDSGAYFCPTLSRVDDYRSGDPPDRIRRAFDGRRAAARRFVAELSRRGVPLLVGQDGVEAEGTLAEMEALADAGVATVEILRAATLHPAESLGLADRFGTLETGHAADLLILEASPLEEIGNVRSVWRVVYEGQLLPAPR